MEYQGVSRKELAAKAGISYSGIGLGIERDSMPGADIALRISRVLNVSIETLLGESPIENLKIGNEPQLQYMFETLRDDMDRLPSEVRESFFIAIHKMTDAYYRR